MSTTIMRPELPPLPSTMEKLPIDERGYPVPAFVAWLDDDLKPVKRGTGRPDFRIIHPGAITRCIRESRCWVCDGKLGAHVSFVVGPMCAVNRTNAEPPSHLLCADWSARACPFLTRPHMRRNEKPKPEDATEMPGIPLSRNPGVAGVWTTKQFRLRRDPDGGLLFNIGECEHVRWYCQGRRATREEVWASIESGLPALHELCNNEADLRALDLEVRAVKQLLPA